jgi:hypothetical protein
VKRLLQLIVFGALAAGLWVFLRELLEADREALSAPGEPGSEGPTPAGNGAGLAGATKAELYERAKKLDVEGRSKMTKDELAAAVAAAERSA